MFHQYYYSVLRRTNITPLYIILYHCIHIIIIITGILDKNYYYNYTQVTMIYYGLQDMQKQVCT